MFGCVLLPAEFTGKTTKSFAQLGVAVTLKLNFAGYIDGAVPAAPK
jgi:hypothetical protein